MKLLQKTQLLFASIQILSFFLPWMKLIPTQHGFRLVGGEIGGFSGFDIGVNMSGNAYLLLIIPLASVALIVSLLLRFDARLISMLTGLLPFCCLFYGYTIFGGNIFALLSYGAFLSLLTGLVLFVSGVRHGSLIKKESRQNS